MNIRPKTVRRLLVLFAAFLLFATGMALLLLRSARKDRATVANLRSDAFRAYEMHDDARAVTLLEQYINRSPAESSDAEAVYAYAMARERVPMDGHAQIAEAISLLQRYLDLAPADPHDAKHELLKLYAQARYSKEALTLADTLLAKNPRDVEALRARGAVMQNDKKPAEALAACQALNHVDPTSLYWQEQELRLMAELKQPNEQIVAHARQLLDAHPDDPRFHANLAIALDLTGDHAGAVAALEAAAKLPPPDAESALQVISLLDAIPRIDLADFLLARSVSRFGNDPRLQDLSIRRLFESEAYSQLLEKLKDVSPASPTASPNWLAFKAIALYQLSRRAEAEAIVKALGERKDATATAWAEALRARFPGQPMEPAVVLNAYRDAIAHDRLNPVFHYFLGDAHASMGEADEALRDWNTASRLSRTWAMPLFRMSRTLSSTGRYPEALRVALVLGRRAPGAIGTQIAYAIAAWGRLQQDPAELQSDKGGKLLQNFEMIRARAPNEPETLAAYVALLSRRGQRDKAVEAVESAIAAPASLPETTFGQLLAVDEQEHLGLEQQLLDKAEKSHGLTAAIAYDRALSLYNAGKKDEAAELVKPLRQAHPNDPQWQLNDSRFRDATGDPDALNTWKALCAAYPQNARIQYAALSTPARFADRAFWQQTIDRVKTLTGPDAQAWQIELARLRLTVQSTPQEIEQTVASLQKVSQSSPELADIHRLLAQALLLTGKPESLAKATAELSAAHDLEPEDFATISRLAALLASQGARDRAAGLVDAVARTPNLAPDRRLWAANMYGELGDPAAGVKLLTAGADATTQPSSSNRDALLASLYVRAGRLDDARNTYLKLLDNPGVAPALLIDAAGFFASMRQTDKANQCLARLKEMKVDDSSVEVISALLQEREGQPAQAARTLTDATRAHPQNERAWEELAGLHLRNGNLDEADKIAAAGLQAIPNAPTLTAMRTQVAGLRKLDRRDAVPLLPTISHSPQQPAAAATVAALADARDRNRPPQDVLSNLRQLADQYPAFVPLQEIVARRYVAGRRYKEAGDLASRAAELRPSDPAPLKLLTDIQESAGDFVAARAAANRWREASAADPLEADLEIAQTYLQQPDADPASAIKQLDPYMTDAAPEPQRLRATPVYCRALLAANRADDAAHQLEPLVTKSPAWIAAWLELATTGAKDATAATGWLNRLVPLLPPNSPGVQVALAEAWQRVGMQFDSPTPSENARKLLDPIVARPPVVASAWEAWALTQQSLGNFAEAERGWNEFLKLDANNPSAKNNLAFVILLEGEAAKLPRAKSMAEEAIAAAPDASTFYDTLARVEGQLGHRTEAIRDFRLAIEKDPNDVEAMVGLADSLQSQPASRDEARAILTRINALLTGGAPLLPPIRKQLDRVKTALSSSMETP